MSSDEPQPCRGCGRDRRACWALPCMHLEYVKARGERAVQVWVRAGLPAELRDKVVVEKRKEG